MSGLAWAHATHKERHGNPRHTARMRREDTLPSTRPLVCYSNEKQTQREIERGRGRLRERDDALCTFEFKCVAHSTLHTHIRIRTANTIQTRFASWVTNDDNGEDARFQEASMKSLSAYVSHPSGCSATDVLRRKWIRMFILAFCRNQFVNLRLYSWSAGLPHSIASAPPNSAHAIEFVDVRHAIYVRKHLLCVVAGATKACVGRRRDTFICAIFQFEIFVE